MTALRNDAALAEAALAKQAASDSGYWPVPILRAVPFLVLGMIITFVNDHSPIVGLTVFGAASIAGAAALGLGSWRWLDDASSRTLAFVQAGVSLVFGIAAVVGRDTGLPLLVALVTGWAILCGVLEVVAGLRRRGRSSLARDWMILGALTLVLAIAYFLVPTDYSKELGGIEKIRGTLTSSTILVGLLGAYGALVGVFLVIQGLSLKWQTAEPRPEQNDDGAQH